MKKSGDAGWMKKKGQSLMEMLVVSVLFISLIQIIFILFWIFVSRMWIEHQLYQGILCVARQQKPSVCKLMVLQKIYTLNPVGRVKEIRIRQIHTEWKGYVRWRIYRSFFFIQQTVRLP